MEPQLIDELVMQMLKLLVSSFEKYLVFIQQSQVWIQTLDYHIFLLSKQLATFKTTMTIKEVYSMNGMKLEGRWRLAFHQLMLCFPTCLKMSNLYLTILPFYNTLFLLLKF